MSGSPDQLRVNTVHVVSVDTVQQASNGRPEVSLGAAASGILVLVAIGAIPLLILEMFKFVRRRREHRRTEGPGYAAAT